MPKKWISDRPGTTWSSQVWRRCVETGSNIHNQQVFSRAIHWRNITHSVADLLKKYSFEKPVSAVLKILRDVIWRRNYRHGGRLCKWLFFFGNWNSFLKVIDYFYFITYLFFYSQLYPNSMMFQGNKELLLELRRLWITKVNCISWVGLLECYCLASFVP